MPALMPNSSGVFPNSVQGFNTAIANQSAPRLNAFGNYGTDPLTGATITDKSSAQNALANFANPNSLQSRALSSMQPTMIPGGGGGGGRMGPRQDRRKIMRFGPRTTSEFTAENGSLSAPRESTLDTAYNSGNLTSGFMPEATGNQGNPLVPNADPLPGGGYNVDLAQFDPPAEQPKMMAKGGPMKMGSKPYLVGEEGPELIMPRQNGEGFVLPADVTAQILPTMRDVTPKKSGGKMAYTPRAEGGPMTLQSPSGRFAAITGDYGTGFASRIPASDGIDLMASDTPRMMFDPSGRYQLNMDAPGLPMQPDTIEGPFAEPAAPVTPAMRADLTAATADRATALAMAPGSIPQSRYPGQTFTDATDPTAPAIPFEELQNRVAMRSIDANNRLFDIRDTAERNRVQLDLAARANRAPLGSAPAPASQIPGMPTMRPSTQRAIDRNQERFLRTPEGAQFALANNQRQAELQQRTQLASTAIPVLGPNGETLGYTTGTGASLPNMNRPRQVTRSGVEIDGEFWNFYDNGDAERVANVPKNPGGGKLMAWDGTKVVDLPPGTDTTNLPLGLTLLGPKSTPEIGGAMTDPKAPGAQPKAVAITGPDDPQLKTLPVGTPITLPSGKRSTIQAR